MAKVKPPFTEADLGTINKIIRLCEETAKVCEDCEKCNLDVDPEKAKNSDQLEVARKLKQYFFPGAK